jgi:LPS-assembly lipoprotein
MTRPKAHQLALALMLALPACGLQPMYAGGSSGVVASNLSAIQVAPIPERAGWLVRNALVDSLGGEVADPAYRLDVELDDDLIAFGIRGDAAVTRERRTLRARYRLVDLKTGEVVLDATAGSDAGIDIVSSEYATVAAEQTAQERLAAVIADQMVSRLALFMRNSKSR